MLFGTRSACSEVLSHTAVSFVVFGTRGACVTHSCLFRGVRHEKRLPGNVVSHTAVSFSFKHERRLLRSVTASLSHTAVSCAVFGTRGIFETCCVTHSCLFRGVQRERRFSEVLCHTQLSLSWCSARAALALEVWPLSLFCVIRKEKRFLEVWPLIS